MQARWSMTLPVECFASFAFILFTKIVSAGSGIETIAPETEALLVGRGR
jgi:hypothetical protein